MLVDEAFTIKTSGSCKAPMHLQRGQMPGKEIPSERRAVYSSGWADER